MASPELEQALDELYRADPSEFVALRKRLAADLRAAGDKIAAKELLGARRPSTSAWALNQLARRQPELIEQLLGRSRTLLNLQTRAIAGKRESMRDATLAHREAAERATQAALAILGPRANEGFRSEISATLRAASTDEDVGRTLQLGRLVREASSEAGFPDATELTVSALPGAPERPRRKAEPPTPIQRSVSVETETLPTVDRKAQRVERAARAEAQRRAAEADVALGEERVAQLERDLSAARQELRDARARSKAAKADARDR